MSRFCLLEFFVGLKQIFNSFGNVTITSEGLQILTYARSDGSLTWNQYMVVLHCIGISLIRNHEFFLIQQREWLEYLGLCLAYTTISEDGTLS